MIQTTIISPTLKDKEIDWSKKQLVIHSDGSLLATSGKHDNDTFYATVISYPNPNHIIGDSTNWQKSEFKPLTEPITITFENK